MSPVMMLVLSFQRMLVKVSIIGADLLTATKWFSRLLRAFKRSLLALPSKLARLSTNDS